jgi:photosystem II stability/assembly factor-like uncharacterized protein
MAKNLGSGVSTVYDGEGYAFDKVVFQQGKPPLDAEFNLAQELQEILTRRSTAHLPSGWLSYRPYYCSSDIANGFYTQDPSGAKPEVALVNGWPVYVTNTGTDLPHVNKVDLSDTILRSGSRTDGVFLEVWRALLSPYDGDETQSKPQPTVKTADLRSVDMYDENTGWAVGENGVILKTVDGGINWISVSPPVNAFFKRVRFLNNSIGYVVGDGGEILKSNDGGESWLRLSSGTTENLNDVFVISETGICAVGDNGTVLLSIDGTNFSIISQISGVTANLNGLTFFDAHVGWAVGDSGTLIVTKDGGLTWEDQTVTDSRTGLKVSANLNSVAFYNLNDGLVTGDAGLILKTSDSGYTWSNMTDRIWYDGAYQSLADIYPTRTTDLSRVVVQRDFPLKFTIAVYPDSKNYFTNIVYKISPANYPNSLVLEFTGTQDHLNYIHVLELDMYATSEELKDAINDIVSPYLASDASLPDESRAKVRVFEADVSYQPFSAPSDFRPTSGSITSLVPAQLSFSVEDRAWIVGAYGMMLETRNSGSKWEIINIDSGFDLWDASFVSSTLGWIVGGDGFIYKYDPVHTSGEQDSDLELRTRGRIYPEGNVLSQADDYLQDNMISPQVGVETTKRVQIQYRIRVVEGIDPFTFPESGLGMPYVRSLGPNADEETAGGYSFENSGDETGDYGMWRSKCRGTVDGYSWAVPMFVVTRRNSAPFNADTNINGSTYYEYNAIRPDGYTYERVVDEDVVDVRRMITVNSYSYLLEKNLDKLLANRLRTNMTDKDQQGLQYGTAILAADSYEGSTPITNLVSGLVTSTAVLKSQVKTFDPNITITSSELTFGPLDKALFHNDPAYYKAVVVRDGTVTEEPVQGTWEGRGTDTAKFTIADNYVPQGGDLTGIEYQITAGYLDYSGEGLSRVPNDPVSVKYRATDTDSNQTYWFNATKAFDDSRVLETISGSVEDHPDYVLAYSAQEIQANVEDESLYELAGNTDPTDADWKRSISKYAGQQYRGSLVEYHYFFKNEASTNTVRIPKNMNGYALFAVRSLSNVVTGAEYKISTQYAADLSLRDRETVDAVLQTANLVVYTDEAYTIPANAIVEVVCEVMVQASDFGGTAYDVGITVANRGEVQDALRTSLTSNYHVASKGVGGLYVGMLYPLTFTTLANQFSLELAASPVPGMQNGVILGLSSMVTRTSDSQMYAWYKSNDPGKDYYTALPIASVDGLGTTGITVTLSPDKSINAGTVLVPILVKLATLPGLSENSLAYAFYKYRPVQTVGNLPDEMVVEVLKGSDFVYITNMGTGSSNVVKGVPYDIPAEQIGVNDDTVVNDNMFSNVDDMDFATYSIDTGFVKLPSIVSNYVGEDMTLSSPNNVGDRLGRTFYTDCDVDVYAQCDQMSISTPRKVFIPMVARVRSDVTSPVMRGELVLLLFSKVYKARTDNVTGWYEDTGQEYAPGYTEEAKTAVCVYRLTNKPLVRK